MSNVLSVSNAPSFEKIHALKERAEVLKGLVDATRKDPSSMAVGAVAVGAGLFSALNGHPIVGVGSMATGIAHIYNKICNSYPANEIGCLLKDVESSTEMLNLLKDNSLSSCEVIKTHLTSADRIITNLEAEMEKINELAKAQGMLDKKHQDALETARLDCLNTTIYLRNIRQNLTEIYSEYKNFGHIFEDIIAVTLTTKNLGSELLRAEEEKKPEIFKNLMEKINEIETLATSGLYSIDEATSKMKSVISNLNEYQTKANSTYLKIGEAQGFSSAWQNLSIQMQEKISYCQEQTVLAKQKVMEAEKERYQLQRRLEDMGQIIEELQTDIAEAESIASGMHTKGEVVVGAIASVAAFSVVGGGLSLATVGATVVAPVAGAVAWKNKNSIIDSVSKFLFNKESPKGNPADPTPQCPVTFEFDKVSTGYWNAYIAKTAGSRTQGTLKVLLPDGEIFSCVVNLNRPKDKISVTDQVALVRKMMNLVMDTQASPAEIAQRSKQCLNIIEEMRNLSFDRGEYKKEKKGIIRRLSPYFNSISTICANLKT